MRHVFPNSQKTAQKIRKEHDLPRDGRKVGVNLARLEKVFREVLAPDMPSYDVNCGQGADFDEWTYTEGLGCFLALTQSIEINARLTLQASQWPGDIRVDYAAALRDGLADKWDLPAQDIEEGVKVFFPPGNNLGWIINTDNVLRAFYMDKSWRLKPHPITSDEDVRQAKLAFGATRIYNRDCSGMGLLRAADTVGYTTTSELGIVAKILGKPTVDFTKFEFEGHGRYHAIYLALRQEIEPSVVLNRLVNCPWSGLTPLNTPSEEARRRFEAYKKETVALRSQCAPLTRESRRPQ